MIFLTRMDGKPVVVNDDLILYAESTPDTVLVLTTGARLMVREPLSVVVERAAEYRRTIHPGLAPQHAHQNNEETGSSEGE